ncbi:hypothetical protein L484_001639 [Morus notabilis]|uniref:Uncharacterized protein n=1 Tax=Morus notabilis TaxID=981085 RepID=W9RS22_9ROSA|nr:hypothetical protein L484_001639 [Morus notabilis]
MQAHEVTKAFLSGEIGRPETYPLFRVVDECQGGNKRHDPKDEYQEASGSKGEGSEESKDWIFMDEEDSPVTLMVKLSSSLLPALCRAGESIDPVPRLGVQSLWTLTRPRKNATFSPRCLYTLNDLISSIANYEEIASMYDQHQCSSSVIEKLKANLEVEKETIEEYRSRKEST